MACARPMQERRGEDACRRLTPAGGLVAPGGRPLGRTITLERSLGIWRIAST